ncbi:MAG: hypothetical protein HYV60_04580 [Planctomycetia bacterium]|nr:hypothetical protein [Planctomycetia bacterium]
MTIFRSLSVLLLLAVSTSGVWSDEPPRQSSTDQQPKASKNPNLPKNNTDDSINFNKARELMQKQRQGAPLTAEERAYVERARAARQGAAAGQPQPDPEGQAGGSAFLELTPLSDLAPEKKYKQQTGGLYGEGRNTPPDKHLQAALAAAQRIRPRNAQGMPDPSGKIVMISLGMSNTTQEFMTFQSLANGDSDKSPHWVIVDGAQGGKDAERWSKPGERGDMVDPWAVLDERLERAGVSKQQVQVAWIKHARSVPRRHGEFPGHARELQEHLLVSAQKLTERYPNMQIAYLSSRIYAGYASVQLNPEPYAYESAFSVRWLIEDQVAGKPELNYDPRVGEVKAPLLLWGPYLWANGEKGRGSDDLVWTRDDLSPRDGTHPSASGRQKVAKLLLDFYKTDPTSRSWFTGGKK